MIVHLALAFAMLLGPAPARDPDAAAGEAAFTAGRWDEASAAFDAAYRSTGNAAYLYARAQAERRADRCKVAIVLYEQFIASGPPPEGEQAAQQYIAECRALLPAEPLPSTVVETSPPAPRDPTPVEPPPSPTPSRTGRDPLALALAVTGGAAVVAGAVLVPLAYRGVSSAADAPDDRDYADRFARARRLEIAGALALSFGAALVTSAVVRWIVLARRKPAATGVARRTTMRAR